jgi:quercetin dioxygenase-like cupin family protein
MYIKTVNDIESSPLTAGNGASMQMLISPQIAPHFAMRKFTIKTGGSMPYHTNSVEHEQYVLKGSAKVIIDGKEKIAKAGDCIFIPAGIAHSYEVIGDENYEFLCLVPNKEDTIKMV